MVGFSRLLLLPPPSSSSSLRRLLLYGICRSSTSDPSSQSSSSPRKPDQTSEINPNLPKSAEKTPNFDYPDARSSSSSPSQTLNPEEIKQINRPVPNLPKSGEKTLNFDYPDARSSSSSPSQNLKPEEIEEFNRLVPNLRNSGEKAPNSDYPDACSSSSSRPQTLKPEEIEEINRLVPNLCDSGHVKEAIALIDASLLAEAPLHLIPFPSLLRRTCSPQEPDMGLSMNLLTALLHNPSRPSAAITTVSAMMIEIYLQHGRPRFALKVFDWMRRPKSPCKIEVGLCGKLVKGLCHHGLLFDAMNVVREMMMMMVDMGIHDDDDDGVRDCLCRRLMYEARVGEAKEMDEALRRIGRGAEEDRRLALEVIDRIIMNWRD